MFDLAHLLLILLVMAIDDFLHLAILDLEALDAVSDGAFERLALLIVYYYRISQTVNCLGKRGELVA